MHEFVKMTQNNSNIKNSIFVQTLYETL